MKAILGIGNPGGQYAGTRHNCGFLVVDELARRAGISTWSHRFHADCGAWHRPGCPVLLLKPTTFVNLSGEAVQAVLAYHKLAPADLLVVVDDLNLPLGHLRVRDQGSAGGHNGLRDIEARIGQAYPRLRLGIGQPPSAGPQQIDHVLGRFTETERPDAEAMITRASDCAMLWLDQGPAAAARMNGPAKPPAPPKPAPKPVTPPPS